MSALSIVTLNVRGLRGQLKRKLVFNWCKRNGFDIVLLQETYSLKSDEKQWEKEWGGKAVWSHGTNHSCGVAIFFGKKFDFGINDTHIDGNGRIAAAMINVEDEKFWLINIYAPNTPTAKQSFFRSVNDLCCNNKVFGEDIILSGDCNIPLELKLDKDKGSEGVVVNDENCNVRKYVNQFISQNNLSNVCRSTYPMRKVLRGVEQYHLYNVRH